MLCLCSIKVLGVRYPTCAARGVVGNLFGLNRNVRSLFTCRPQGSALLPYKRRQSTSHYRGKRYMRLQISDPAAILNAIATKYESSTRVLMEYVDNSLDSAENLKQLATTSVKPGFPRPISIHIGIDQDMRQVWISDNCQGIDPEMMMRLVSNIGESKKKGVAWLNGQFGFGLHAFRAAADSLHVYSAVERSNLHYLSISRKSVDFDEPVPLKRNDVLHDSRLQRAFSLGLLGNNTEHFDQLDSGFSGSAILLENIDKLWFKPLHIKGVAAEIQQHFESLLQQEELTISVSTHGTTKRNKTTVPAPASVVCRPFDYGVLEGEVFAGAIPVAAGKAIKYHIVVSKQVVPNRRPRFFKNGRCISGVSETRSFMEDSPYKDALWGHPALCGYIEVGDCLQPVITRDEFAKSEDRATVYTALRTLETQLNTALDSTLVSQMDENMSDLEDVLQASVAQIVRRDSSFLRAMAEQGADESVFEPIAAGTVDVSDDDRHPQRTDDSDPSAALDTVVRDDVEYKAIKKPGKNSDSARENRPSKKRRGPFEIKFVDVAADEVSHAERSFATGTCLYINVAHRDFQERMHRDSKGRLRFNARVAAYLANELACHYRMKFYEKFDQAVPHERERLYHELCDSVNSVESVLNTKIATLERKIRSKERFTE
eukprot:m.651465 g.651465  ORF g.651465 m.651465 type:complete len:658 (+) comp22676_c0_seq11:137-2110(+)